MFDPVIQNSDQYDILIVDDAPDSLVLLNRILEERGYRVRAATNGSHALKAIEARLPDLILLDVKMPVMDGYEICRRLKSDDRSREVPVIFISALGETAKKVEGFKAGGVDYITKPFETEEVLARVSVHLRLRELTERLEQKVTERTIALKATNEKLQHELAERKRADEEIHRLNRDLEQRVHYRTAELESANKELEGFAYSVSHDLRAPIRHIDGFLELLKKRLSGLDERSCHYFESISEAVQRMELLIDDLLSYSRVGFHTPSLKKEALGVLVRDILREFELDTTGRKIDWRIGNLPVVNGDKFMLRIVLLNLISNAIKFTRPRNKAQIEIGSQTGKNSETIIFIRDNGVGFDMAYSDKLFGVFQRLHHKGEFEGTGIGLATVQKIINRHGGRTWAKGETDRGATFYFSLPQSVQEA
ncbi:MAG: response regulator [Chitinispirillia bacterium]|jgi:light-regulated signal transduction histidine kinase (bacteriophytochrome)